MTAEPIRLDLSHAEALVLLDWIYSLEARAIEFFRHPAEQKMVWLLESQLESMLPASTEPGYTQLIADARDAVDASEA